MRRAIKQFPGVFAIVRDQLLWRDDDQLTAIVKAMSVAGGFRTLSLLHADSTERMTGVMDLINMNNVSYRTKGVSDKLYNCPLLPSS